MVLIALALAVVFSVLARNGQEQKYFMVEQPSSVRQGAGLSSTGTDSGYRVIRTFTITIPTSSFPEKKE